MSAPPTSGLETMIPYVLTANEDEETLARGTADIGSLQVAHVYGEALLNAAEKAGQTDEVLGELDALLQTTAQRGTGLRQFFASGVIGRVTRRETIQKAFEGRIHPLVLNLLLVLNEHERLPLLPAVLFQANQLKDRRAFRLPVHVHTAAPLDDAQLDRIREAVRRNLKVEPVMEVKIDPELLGGVLFRVGDWVFDGSVRTKLNELRKEIIERSSHEIQSGRDRFSSATGN